MVSARPLSGKGRDVNFGLIFFFSGGVFFLAFVFSCVFRAFLVCSFHFATFSCQFSKFSSILWSFPFNSLRILLNSV